MSVYASTEFYELRLGAMQDELLNISPNSIDSVVTDPPYELNFMNKGWDNTGVAFNVDTWKRCYNVLKPGGYLLAFGGSRTYHRIACAIEDAGFEIRDTIMWIYGSGFPKSMNLGKAIESKLQNGSANPKDFRKLDGTKVESGNWGISKMALEQDYRPSDYCEDKHLRVDKVDYKTELGKKYDGWGTSLKPAFEPIIVARKPFTGSLVDNVLKYEVGGLNIDECRVTSTDTTGNYEGRFPSNVILTYDEIDFDEVCGGFPHTFEQTSNVARKYTDYVAPNDSGAASRYFYCAKASKKDREEGLDYLQDGLLRRMRPDKDDSKPTGLNREGRFAPVVRKNTHPTVKPTELMQYLIRLVTSKGGTVLDPFMGSGSTGKATMIENKERDAQYKFIGVEMTEEYLPICKGRIDFGLGWKVEEVTETSGEVTVQVKKPVRANKLF